MIESLKDAQALVTAFRDERDWRQFHTPKELAAALAIEAAELQQELLWKQPHEVEALLQHPDTKTAIADETADIFAYLLAFADICEIDLGAALEAKMHKNAAKYPAAQVRGDHRKYSAYKRGDQHEKS